MLVVRLFVHPSFHPSIISSSMHPSKVEVSICVLHLNINKNNNNNNSSSSSSYCNNDDDDYYIVDVVVVVVDDDDNNK